MTDDDKIQGLSQAEEAFLRGDETALTPEGTEPPKPAEEPKAGAVEPEPAAEPAEPDAEPKPSKVDYGALAEERAKRREEAAARRAAEESLQRLQDRLLALQERQGQPDQAKEPTVEDNPIEAIKKTEAAIAQMRAEQQQAAELSMLSQALAQHETEHATKAPDYWEAKSYLRKSSFDDYIDAGFEPNEAVSRLAQDEAILAKLFLTKGQNPAEKFYAMAKRRGFAASPQAPAVDPAAVEAEKKAAEAKKLEVAAKGQAAAKSLAAAGGAASDADESVEALLKMSNEEFAKATEGKKWKRIAGGG